MRKHTNKTDKQRKKERKQQQQQPTNKQTTTTTKTALERMGQVAFMPAYSTVLPSVTLMPNTLFSFWNIGLNRRKNFITTKSTSEIFFSCTKVFTKARSFPSCFVLTQVFISVTVVHIVAWRCIHVVYWEQFLCQNLSCRLQKQELLLIVSAFGVRVGRSWVSIRILWEFPSQSRGGSAGGPIRSLE